MSPWLPTMAESGERVMALESRTQTMPLLACVLLALFPVASYAADLARPVKTVGVVFDGPAPEDDTVLSLSRRDLTL